MKKLLLSLLLVACGDNIVPGPDAPSSEPDETGDLDSPTEPGAPADAGVDAPLPVCDDKHVVLNGHKHKCQHEQKK